MTVTYCKVYLIGGSIPEVANGSYYNTSTVWCPQGELLATHRKVHLFDIGNVDTLCCCARRE